MSGCARDRVLDQRISTLWPRDRIEEYREFNDQVRRGVPLLIEGPMTTASGDHVDTSVSWSKLVDDDGEPTALVAVGHLLDERRGIEHELRQRLALHQSLAEQSSNGVLQLSMEPRWRIMFANGVARRSFSLRPGDDPASLLERCVGDAGPLETLLRGEEDGEVDLQVTGDDGVHDLTAATVRVVDATGTPRYVVASIRDHTSERHRALALESALQHDRDATATLRRTDRVRQMLLTSVSHELRTPLTVAAAVAETLRDRIGELEPDVVMDLVDRLHRSTGRLEHLLDEIIDVDRLMRDTTVTEQFPVDLHEIVARALADPHVGTDAVSRGPVGEPLVASVDAARLRRSVQHLVRNALEHGGREVRVTVRAWRGPDADHIEVRDDGVGVDSDAVRDLVHAFAQGMPPADMASPGLGIGLTLVSEVARAHGGELDLRPGDDGCGHRAAIILPHPAEPAT